MTVTPAKLEANRRNAKKSTGPRTTEGKQRSSRNAATHGIFCNDLVLPRESQEEFEALRNVFLLELRPAGFVEMMFVDRIVIAAWKLKRLNRIESIVTESYAHQITKGARKLCKKHGVDPATLDPADTNCADSQAVGFAADRSHAMERMGRHAQRLELSISRSMRELARYRKEFGSKDKSLVGQLVGLDTQRLIMPQITRTSEADLEAEEVVEEESENRQNEAKGEEGSRSEKGDGSASEKTSGLKPAAENGAELDSIEGADASTGGDAEFTGAPPLRFRGSCV